MVVPFTSVLRIAPVSLIWKFFLSTVLITVSLYIFHVTKNIYLVKHNSKLCEARCYHSGVLTRTEVQSRRGESVQLYSVQYRCVQYRCTLQYRAARCDQGCSVTYVGGGGERTIKIQTPLLWLYIWHVETWRG